MTYFGVPELDANMDGMLAMVDKLDSVQERLAELTGSATSEDEHISVTIDSQGKVSEVTLNPRVMRMASEDLAEALKQVVNDAHDDAQKRSQELLAEFTGPVGMNLTTATETSANVKDAVSELMRAARGDLSPEEVTAAMNEATRKVTGLDLP